MSVGDQITASVDTGAGEKMVQLEAIGILENKDDGVVFYTDTENLQALAAMDCTSPGTLWQRREAQWTSRKRCSGL